MPPLEALIALHHDAAKLAHPDIVISQADFIEEVKRRLGDELREQVIRTCSTNDVYVMIAASRGDQRAVDYVEAQLAHELEAAGPAVKATPEQLADARSVIRELLFTDREDRVAVAKSYAGLHDLHSFLRVIAQRELIEIVRPWRT